jgi:hypothetical protein
MARTFVPGVGWTVTEEPDGPVHWDAVSQTLRTIDDAPVPGTPGGPAVDSEARASASVAQGMASAVSGALASHASAADPHPGYQTQTESDARYVRTVNGSAPDGAGNVVVSGTGGSALPTAITPVTAIPLDGNKVFNADTVMSATALTIAAGQVEGGSCSLVVKGDGSSTWGGITGAQKANGAATFSNTLNAVNHILVWVDRGRVRYTVSQSDPIEIASASVAPTTAAPTIINSVVGQALTWTAGAMTGSPTPTATFNLRQSSTAIASAISNGAYVPQVAAGAYQLDQVAANGVSPNATATATVTLTAQPYAVSGGASGGVASVASPAFTLTVSGVLAASTVITPSDNGGGGTFTPSTVTIAPGTNQTGTFTYTPSSTPGARTISFTNSAALANPASITYTSTATLSVPVNTSAPTIASGSTARPVGYSQSSLTGSWTNSPTSYLYKWQRSTDGGVSWADISGATASTYTLVDADAGNVHRVGVRAVNGAGPAADYTYSAASAVVTAIAPGAPTGLSSASVTSSGFTGSFTAPASTGGAAIDDYKLQTSTNSGSTWVDFADATSTALSIAVTGLAASTAHQWRVAAHNSAGWGAWSTAATVTTAGASYSPPVAVGLRATDIWDAVTETGDYAGGYVYTGSTGNKIELWAPRSAALAQATYAPGFDRVIVAVDRKTTAAASTSSPSTLIGAHHGSSDIVVSVGQSGELLVMGLGTSTVDVSGIPADSGQTDTWLRGSDWASYANPGSLPQKMAASIMASSGSGTIGVYHWNGAAWLEVAKIRPSAGIGSGLANLSARLVWMRPEYLGTAATVSIGVASS